MSGRQPIFGTTLRSRTAVAVADPRLKASLANATDTFAARKGVAFAQLADPEGARTMARSAKAAVLARLPELLESFADRLLARGVHVWWAADAAEANAHIAAIAASTGSTRVVKSKSMATEETGLNDALEAVGCTVTETDLGEWIIQLARETPSHIIVPAIHRDRHQIADVLNKVAGGDLAAVPEELAAFARARLRQRFLEADLGISGANFGVAETGSIVLVTNEGNGRLVTSVPRVHVAVLGMERLVETWDQLDLMLALLPRAATGQPITTYVSTITGPRRVAAGETEGPEELHVVILDNGRSAILGTEFHEMLACIRCGACLNACPVYRQAGGHAYGWVYSGPMGAVLTPLLLDSPEAPELANASSLCGACWDACPVGIPLQDLLLGLRRRAAPSASRRTKAAWSTWATTWSRPRGYRMSLRTGALAGRMLGGAVAHVPGAARWTGTRTAPVPARRSFRDRWDAGEV
ncbi:MAG TPA: LutB/LldF family L-lactate oxidation iron-sulfur protein [Acidimicrobiales bacterium]|nr:LutB/LldF family L-lactate oxidation iron-sulfur protein [Acidimicrobiales bacterium]